MTTQELIGWALDEYHLQRREPPTRLHSQGNRDDDPKTMDRDTARGLPFSKSFEKYLDGAPINTPARQALAKLKAHGRKQSDEYRVCYSLIVQGDATRTTAYPSVVVHRALTALRELCDTVSAAT